MSVTHATMRRLMREITELKNSPPEGIRIVTSEENMLDVTGIIEGPEGTPYAGGYFRVRFKFTEEFPAAPPKCWFATKIFHPNVSSAGEICVNTLKKDWKSTYGIGHILVTVKCLLIYPNPESALDEEAGKLLLEDYESYCSRAKLITNVHATSRTKPQEFEAPVSDDSQSTPSIRTTTTNPAAPVPAPALTIPPTSSPRKSASPAPPSQPLQSSPANTLPTSFSSSSLSDGQDRVTSPSPLSTADSNVAGTPNTAAATKAVKRSAASGTSGMEKRKKALKRL
ncbi:ubiquitin-conjugating enzyme/RWD-like protein [Phlebopus sp. FC_14]|nr:ubiquitin-conjugating enzyme/RWD-like protein [Phlebopus sp. FC_14]